MEPSNPSELCTERLTLRPVELDDAERLAVIANDRRIARNLTAGFPHPYTRADAEQFLGSEPDSWAVTITGGGEDGSDLLIGLVGASTHQEDDPGVYLFGYWFGVDYWGQGYATEAARAFLDHLIATSALRRIEAWVYGWNETSGRVLEKLGFEFEGRCRLRASRFGEVTDELVYGLVVS